MEFNEIVELAESCHNQLKDEYFYNSQNRVVNCVEILETYLEYYKACEEKAKSMDKNNESDLEALGNIFFTMSNIDTWMLVGVQPEDDKDLNKATELKKEIKKAKVSLLNYVTQNIIENQLSDGTSFFDYGSYSFNALFYELNTIFCAKSLKASLLMIDGCEVIWLDDTIDSDSCYCVDCGERISYENSYYVEGHGRVCERCIEDYSWCDCCENYVLSEEIHEDLNGNWYCDCCIANGYGNWDDDETPNITRSQDGHRYHWTRKFEKLVDPKENEITYGFELETIPNSSISREKFKDYEEVAECNFIDHHDHDGSLCGYRDKDGRCEDGVEFVSKVFTYDFVKNNTEELKVYLETLSKIGYTSHDNNLCGLHFHMGMNGNCMPKDASAKLVYFVHKNWEWFAKFTRRTKFNYCDDIIENRYGCKERLNKFKSTKGKVNELKKMSLNNGHGGFYVDEDSRTHTSEFRMFRGTLNYETFLASFYYLNAMMLVANSKRKLTHANVVRKLKQLGDYDIVNNYCVSRGICINGIMPTEASLLEAC